MIVNNGEFLSATYYIDSEHTDQDCLVASYSDGTMRPITVGGKVIVVYDFGTGIDTLDFDPTPFITHTEFVHLVVFVPYEDESPNGDYTNPLECSMEMSDVGLNITLGDVVVSSLPFGATSPLVIRNIRPLI